ncbi:hypothetical protein [Helicobacter sp. MIT 01-3238]|nr:hypothetical protein [Helicobacter sp. MIT 01-3238]
MNFDESFDERYAVEFCTLYVAKSQKGTNIARFYLWIWCVV